MGVPLLAGAAQGRTHVPLARPSASGLSAEVSAEVGTATVDEVRLPDGRTSNGLALLGGVPRSTGATLAPLWASIRVVAPDAAAIGPRAGACVGVQLLVEAARELPTGVARVALVLRGAFTAP